MKRHADKLIEFLFRRIDRMMNQTSEEILVAFKEVETEAERLGIEVKGKKLRDLFSEVRAKNPKFRIRILF